MASARSGTMPARLNRWACRPLNVWPSMASAGIERPRASTAAWNSPAISARLELISSRWSSVSGVPGAPIALYLPTANTSTLIPSACERGGIVDHGLHHADGADLGGWGGVDGAGLAGDPVGRRTHQAGGERIDRFALVDGCDGGGQFGSAGHGAAGRVDVEKHRLMSSRSAGLTQGRADFLGTGGTRTARGRRGPACGGSVPRWTRCRCHPRR